MIDERFVYLGVGIALIGGVSYFIDTIKGRVKPNRVTWFMWGLAPLIAFFAQVKEGVGISSLLTFAVGFMPMMIFFASFLNKKAYWKITAFDLICGLLSLVGLGLWLVTQVGNIAIIFSIVADGLAAIPTYIKSYKRPETESVLAFLTSGIGSFITLLTLKSWDFASYGFPLYMMIMCTIFVILIQFKPRRFFIK